MGGASGDDDESVGIFALELANGLPALAFGLSGHGAGVDDDNVVRKPLNFLYNGGFIRIEAASECNDPNGHGKTLKI